MKFRIRLAGLVSLLALAVGAWAHDDKMMPMRPATPEFQQMKQLVGNWKGTTTPMGKGQKPEAIAIEIKVTAAGSAIEETLMPGTPHEMVDMYHDEGGKLAMTHYCAMGNQPRMLLSKATPTQITLEMGPTPGIDSAKDPHMHTLVLDFPDANHLTERWTNYVNGQPAETAVFTLARAK